MLSCECSEYDSDIHSYSYMPADDYSNYSLGRGRRCSCGTMIKRNDTCTEHARGREATDFEYKKGIYRDDEMVAMSSIYLCEACSDIFFSLSELGFCIDLQDKMAELLEEFLFLQAHNELPDCMRK